MCLKHLKMHVDQENERDGRKRRWGNNRRYR